jgi:hypothetical protein
MDHQEGAVGWLVGVTAAVVETLSVHAPWLFRRPMGWLQDTHRAQGIIDAMGAMVSISRCPDLTRLGISAGAAEGLGLITTIRTKCAEMGAKGGGRAGSRKADTINAFGDTNSIYAGEIQVNPKEGLVRHYPDREVVRVGAHRAPEDRVVSSLPLALSIANHL